MTLWSKLMEQAIGALKDEKVSLSLLGLVVMIAWYAHAWATEEFVDKQQFDEHTQEVENKLDTLQTVINQHVEEYRIVEASRVIRDLKRDIQLAETIESPAREVAELKEELRHAEEYKRCLVGRLPNCQHLRWPE